ncbi:MAG: hypothetical protein RI897_3058 [Verrucomicrobiota bacterium]
MSSWWGCCGLGAGDVGIEGIVDDGEQFSNFEREAVGFGDGFDFGVAVAGPEDSGQLAAAVEAFVIEFGDEDVVEAGEDFFEAVGQRVEVADMEAADFLAGGLGAVDGFADGAEAGAPADEEDIT